MRQHPPFCYRGSGLCFHEGQVFGKRSLLVMSNMFILFDSYLPVLFRIGKIERQRQGLHHIFQ
jgi:hypothetical protein